MAQVYPPARASPGHERPQPARSPARRAAAARDAAPELSRRRPARASRMLDWHRAPRRQREPDARHFGVLPPDRVPLARAGTTGFASRPSRTAPPRPLRRRRPTWTLAELAGRPRDLRERYPRWGKDKLAVLLRREPGSSSRPRWSAGSSAGCGAAGELREPRRRRISVRQRRWARPYAVRTPAGRVIEAPGDLVELDTLDIRPLPGQVCKQFTARDVVSAAGTSSSSAGGRPPRPPRAVLDAPRRRMPFRSGPSASTTAPSSWPSSRPPVPSGGSALFVLPPRSPKLHGAVERANRTHTEEFYEVTDAEPDLAAFQVDAAGLGDRLQHHPAPPGARLPHPRRVPGLARDRCVTDVPNEYRSLDRGGSRVHRPGMVSTRGTLIAPPDAPVGHPATPSHRHVRWVGGRSVPRRDGPAKVTGAARYADDLSVDGAWFGLTVRSTEPHARLLGIDRDPALRLVAGRRRHGGRRPRRERRQPRARRPAGARRRRDPPPLPSRSRWSLRPTGDRPRRPRRDHAADRAARRRSSTCWRPRRPSPGTRSPRATSRRASPRPT